MIGTAYNYKDPNLDPKYMISEDIPGFSKAIFGFASGFAFTALFSLMVLFSGVVVVIQTMANMVIPRRAAPSRVKGGMT